MSDIPLTTTLTPPASCFDNSYTSWDTEYYIKGYKGRSISCYPFGYTDLLEHNVPFSPGVCADRYVIVTQMLLPGTGSGTGTEQGPKTTRAYCCPSPMTRPDDGELGCVTSASDTTVLALPTKTTTVQNVTLGMAGIYVAGTQTDLLVFASADSTSPPSSSMLPAPSVSTSPAPQSTPNSFISPSSSLTVTATSVPSSTTLPTRTIVIISIGTTASLAALVTFIAFAVLARRRRRRKRANAYVNPVDVRVFDNTSKSHQDMGRWSWLSSLWSSTTPRSDGGQGGDHSILGYAKQEMGAGGEVHEADSKCLHDGKIAEADSRCVGGSVEEVQEADSRGVGSREITELEGD